ncbi:MAG: hypothetical protein IJU37_12385 [Desulfovibrio sp.]|nr:hypothetical protein [Desulfovibrio sp.]
MPLNLIMSCICLLLMMDSAIANENVIVTLDTYEWPLLTIDYKRPASPLNDIYITVTGINKKIQPTKIQKILDVEQQNLLFA